MCERKDVWQSRYYAIPKIYMSLIGIWPFNVRNRYLRFAISFFCSFSIIVPQVSYLVAISISLDDIFDCVPAIIITIIFSYKLYTLMVNNDKVKTCLKRIEEDWLSLNTDMEKNILHKQARYGQYVTIFYAVSLMSLVFSYVLEPLLTIFSKSEDISNTTKSISKASSLPYLVEYGEKFNEHVYLIILHCYASIVIHAIITIAADTLYQTLIQHACGMFNVIGHTLENIGKDNEVNFQLEPSKMQDNNYMEALNCLRRHLHVIEFAKLIETIYTKVLFISVNLNIIAGTLFGLQVVMNLNNAKDVVSPLSMYFGQLLHLYLQFWQAQLLLDYSVVPYQSIGNWYYTSRRCQKVFLLIMIRAMSPCKITAGKIMTLSIESYGAVLKTSMSYFAMLRSFQ